MKFLYVFCFVSFKLFINQSYSPSVVKGWGVCILGIRFTGDPGWGNSNSYTARAIIEDQQMNFFMCFPLLPLFAINEFSEYSDTRWSKA